VAASTLVWLFSSNQALKKKLVCLWARSQECINNTSLSHLSANIFPAHFMLARISSYVAISKGKNNLMNNLRVGQQQKGIENYLVSCSFVYIKCPNSIISLHLKELQQ
jgi:hypothetical protein